ncbi:MAG: universal stress protein [Bacteroidota bacterium]
MMYKHIFTGLDLTSFDDQILQYLQAQNAWLTAGTHTFFHVSPSLEVPKYLQPDLVPEPGVSVEEQVQNQIAGFVQLFMPYAKGQKSYVVKEGPVTRTLLQNLKLREADLAVVGRKFAQEFSGLGARRFIRHAPSDVLIVPPDTVSTLRRIVIATDFSKYSDWALQKAIEIAQKIHVELVLLHVFEVPPTWHSKVGRTQQQFDAMIRANLEDYLDKYMDELDTKGVEITPILIERDDTSLGHEIIRFAENAEADLLIMGVKGRNHLDTFLLGSITEKVLNLNPTIPMLVVKNPIAQRKQPVWTQTQEREAQV